MIPVSAGCAPRPRWPAFDLPICGVASERNNASMHPLAQTHKARAHFEHCASPGHSSYCGSLATVCWLEKSYALVSDGLRGQLSGPLCLDDEVQDLTMRCWCSLMQPILPSEPCCQPWQDLARSHSHEGLTFTLEQLL